MKHNRTQIQEMHKSGMSYNTIAKKLNTSKSTIAYHISSSVRKNNYIRSNKYRNNNSNGILARKLNHFRQNTINTKNKISNSRTINEILSSKRMLFAENRKIRSTYMKLDFTIEDIKNKIGGNPKCYLTGQPIDLSKSRSYHFDHVIPVSRGGDNSLDNLQIASKQANSAKNDMTPDEFINLCKQVLEHNGYIVGKEEVESPGR